MQGIACDVGHTIIVSSVMNILLEAQGKQGAITELYNEERLGGLAQYQVDGWVAKAMASKITALSGLGADEIAQACRQVELRSGFEQFAASVLEAQIPILFIGAVPELVTRALLSRTVLGAHEGKGVDIIGSQVILDGETIEGAGEICTPSRKAQSVARWATAQGISPEALYVIGDSIGDVPAMRLTGPGNRIAIEGASKTLGGMAGRHVRDFFEVSKICFSSDQPTALAEGAQ